MDHHEIDKKTREMLKTSFISYPFLIESFPKNPGCNPKTVRSHPKLRENKRNHTTFEKRAEWSWNFHIKIVTNEIRKNEY